MAKFTDLTPLSSLNSYELFSFALELYASTVSACVYRAPSTHWREVGWATDTILLCSGKVSAQCLPFPFKHYCNDSDGTSKARHSLSVQLLSP